MKLLIKLLVIVLISCSIIYGLNKYLHITYKDENHIQNYNSVKQDYCEDKFLNDDNIKILNIRGYSMKPTLSHSNKIICDSSIIDYEPGMIININDSFTHRIKAVYSDYVITQGDSNLREDDKIEYEDINCVVIGVCY